jgi:fluoroquinolone resistance protein
MKIVELIFKKSQNACSSTTEEIVVEHDSLSHYKFEHNKLTGVVFNEIEFTDCFFDKVDFSGDTFFSSLITNCHFINCNFSNCDTHNTTVLNSTFTKCIFGKCELYGHVMKNCKFIESNISWVYGDDLMFDGGEISNSSLENSVFTSSKFINNSFINNKTIGLKIHASEMYYVGMLTTENEQIKRQMTGNS